MAESVKLLSLTMGGFVVVELVVLELDEDELEVLEEEEELRSVLSVGRLPNTKAKTSRPTNSTAKMAMVSFSPWD